MMFALMNAADPRGNFDLDLARPAVGPGKLPMSRNNLGVELLAADGNRQRIGGHWRDHVFCLDVTHKLPQTPTTLRGR